MAFVLPPSFEKMLCATSVPRRSSFTTESITSVRGQPQQAAGGKPESNNSLEDIIQSSEGGVFNNAAGWNHTFYWRRIKRTGGQPIGDLLDAIQPTSLRRGNSKSSSLRPASRSSFRLAGCRRQGKLRSQDLQRRPALNTDRSTAHHDVWSMPYYIDYRTCRQVCRDVPQELVNWDFALENLGKATEPVETTCESMCAERNLDGA